LSLKWDSIQFSKYKASNFLFRIKCIDSTPFCQGSRGTLNVLNWGVLPFPIKRVFWIEGVGSGEVRGQHAHVKGHEILVCLRGSLKVRLHKLKEIELSKGSSALWVKPQTYIEMTTFSPDVLLLVLCSDAFCDDPVIK